MCGFVCWYAHVSKVPTEARGTRSLGSGVTYGCESPGVSAKNPTQLLGRPVHALSCLASAPYGFRRGLTLALTVLELTI